MNGHKEDIDGREWTIADTILACMLVAFAALVAFAEIFEDGLR